MPNSTTKRVIRAAAALLLLALPLAAQQQPAPAPAPQATFKSEVRQVLLDVVVSSGDHPVTGLKQDDFSIFEDGKPQQILSFEAHAPASEAATTKRLALPQLPRNTFLNAPTGYDDLPLNILLYDVLNTPTDAQPFAHKEVIRFLQNKPTGSRFAIFVLSDRVHLLQGFTDDERQLIAAMSRKQTGSYASTTYQPAESVNDTSSQLSDADILPPNDANAQALVDRMQHMESVVGNFLLLQRVEKTVNAFLDISNFVAGLPGRKNLIWLSGSFPSQILPGNDPVAPFDTALGIAPELRRAADAFAAQRIAVYPVDIRGLEVNPVFGAANSRVYRSSDSFNASRAKFSQRVDAEHATMDKVAEDSGGRAFYDTNGLRKAIATGTDDGATYYTLSYSPTNKKFDGSLRSVRIAVAHSGYHLAYRHNYLADEDTAMPDKPPVPPSDTVTAAMRLGAPSTHDLVFKVHLAPLGSPSPITPAQITQLSKSPAFESQKNWDAVKIQRYDIEFALLGRQLSFASVANGAHKGSFDFVFAAYSTDGSALIAQQYRADQSFSQQEFEEIRKGIYQAHEVIDIPASATWLRLGVHDALSNRIGSLEIPLPLAPEPQAATNVTSPVTR